MVFTCGKLNLGLCFPWALCWCANASAATSTFTSFILPSVVRRSAANRGRLLWRRKRLVNHSVQLSFSNLYCHHLKAGRIRSIGVSNYGVAHLKEIVENWGREDWPSVNQVSWRIPHLRLGSIHTLSIFPLSFTSFPHLLPDVYLHIDRPASFHDTHGYCVLLP